MSFAHIDEVLEMPNLIEVQKNSYQWFLDEGLREVFKDVSGITDYTGNLVLDFVNYKLDIDKPNYSVAECKERDATYSAALRETALSLIHISTQVFLAPEGDHYRTRLTHTLEVTQIARTVARALRVNEDLTEAIALGHDLGHTPFGHAGERELREICPYGFEHNEQSVRVVECMEKAGRGLNLTWDCLFYTSRCV